MHDIFVLLAPAVALAGLAIVLLEKGARDAHQNAVGMLAGSAGMGRLRRLGGAAAASCACHAGSRDGAQRLDPGRRSAGRWGARGMNGASEEASIAQRIDERPSFRLGKVRQVRLRHLACRFLAGALTSIGAGALTLGFGPHAGGIFLAFPAILAASLSLIEEQEDSAEAREDARGAAMGGLALAAFAAVAAVALGGASGAIALLLAAIAWFAVAFSGYALAWLGRR